LDYLSPPVAPVWGGKIKTDNEKQPRWVICRCLFFVIDSLAELPFNVKDFFEVWVQ
jgi:hypothetical protein